MFLWLHSRIWFIFICFNCQHAEPERLTNALLQLSFNTLLQFHMWKQNFCNSLYLWTKSFYLYETKWRKKENLELPKFLWHQKPWNGFCFIKNKTALHFSLKPEVDMFWIQFFNPFYLFCTLLTKVYVGSF